MPLTLETSGQVCPFPLVEAKDAIASLPDGDYLTINFDCTQATDAIPRWAATEGYPVTWCDFSGGHTPAPNSAQTIWDFFAQF